MKSWVRPCFLHVTKAKSLYDRDKEALVGLKCQHVSYPAMGGFYRVFLKKIVHILYFDNLVFTSIG